jgi:phosphatidylglycerophosphate synthase
LSPAKNTFLRHSGKSQDGIVAKFLNRPISRVITRLLLKLPITPNAWTILTFALAPVAFVYLVRGDYIGFLAGTAVFQLINILDGCDGEIARAKYLDSERGRRLDAFCDFVANLLFVLCLGIGLFRQPAVSANVGLLYLLESLITFFIMAGGFGRYLMPLLAHDTNRVASRRHEDFNLAERFFRSRADRFHLSNHPARRDLFCVSPLGNRRLRVMDLTHFFRLFRDHAGLQAVQKELAASRGNSLVMVVDDRGTAKISAKCFGRAYLTIRARCVRLDTN